MASPGARRDAVENQRRRRRPHRQLLVRLGAPTGAPDLDIGADRDDDPTGDIRSNAEFKPYLEQVPSSVTSLSFADWKANFEGMYQMVTSMAAFIPMDDRVPIDLSLLPDVTTLTEHLFGSVSWNVVDADGFHMFSQGPWGPETAALFAGVIGAGAGVAGAMESGMIR